MSGRRNLYLLLLIGVVMALGFAYAAVGLRAWNGARDVASFLGLFALLFLAYAAACWLVLARETSHPRTLLLIFSMAALFRLCMLPAGLPQEQPWKALTNDLSSTEVGYERYLLYDQDVWRYLWDGHVLTHGLSPYAHSPEAWEDLAFSDDPRAAALFAENPWPDLFHNIAYQDYLTVYPPLAQALFAGLQVLLPGSVFALKAVLAVLDLLACWLLYRLLLALGRRGEEVLLYAWNPLLTKELAGSGHVDGLVLPLLIGAALLAVRLRQRLSLACLGLAVLAKVTPLVLAAPFLLRSRLRQWPILAGTLLLGFLPFVITWPRLWEGLREFGSSWTFNPGLWLLVQRTAQTVLEHLGAGDNAALVASRLASGLWLGFVGVASLYVLLRGRREPEALPRQLYFLLVIFLLSGPTVMPWYLLWALPFAVASGHRAWLGVTGLALLSYLIYIDGQERAWWLVLEHSVIALLLLGELWWRRKRGSEDNSKSSDSELARHSAKHVLNP